MMKAGIPRRNSFNCIGSEEDGGELGGGAGDMEDTAGGQVSGEGILEGGCNVLFLGIVRKLRREY